MQLRPGLRIAPMRQFVTADDTPRIREGRHPAPVDELRVPADMIHVEMGVDHHRHILGPHPAGGQVVEIGQIPLVGAAEFSVLAWPDADVILR